MHTYNYVARDSSGASLTGSVNAATEAEAIKIIRAEGKYPVSVKADFDDEPAQKITGAAGVKISRSNVIDIATQLSIMMETGVTLSEALDCISQQVHSPNVKSLLADLCAQIQEGLPFSSALARHPRSFPRLFIALIKASEKTGMMSKLLARAVSYMRDEQETIRRVKGALTYPAIMLAFAISTTIFLLAFVLPRFTVIYASKKAALPIPTKVLMDISEFMTGHVISIVSGVIFVSTLLYFYLRTTTGRRSLDYVQLNLPLLGSLFRKVHLSRALRMVGTMAGAGVNLTECISTAHDLCSNSYYRDLWSRVSEQITAGKQLSDPLFESTLVPRPVSQMIFSGEKSGKLAYVMEQIAGFSEVELKEQIVNLTRFIEPAMIMVMGLIIGGVASALLLPIFTISKVMAQ